MQYLIYLIVLILISTNSYAISNIQKDKINDLNNILLNLHFDKTSCDTDSSKYRIDGDPSSSTFPEHSNTTKFVGNGSCDFNGVDGINYQQPQGLVTMINSTFGFCTNLSPTTNDFDPIFSTKSSVASTAGEFKFEWDARTGNEVLVYEEYTILQLQSQATDYIYNSTHYNCFFISRNITGTNWDVALYVNSTINTSTTGTGSFTSMNQNFRIGHDSINGYFMEDGLDEFMIWNFSLNSEQINYVMRAWEQNKTIPNNRPNVTNVTIGTIPLNPNDIVYGAYNVSDSDNDKITGNQTYWYLNNTLVIEANNSFLLLAGNITLDANITFSIRFNDSLGWSDWTNSSIVMVGDTTAPSIFGNSTQGITSFTTSEIVNITVNVSDKSNLASVIVEINRTGTSTITNYTMSHLNNEIYQISPQTFAADNYIITNFYATDTSNNEQRTISLLTFEVTSSSSSSSSTSSTTGGGGGGGGTLILIEKTNVSLIFKPPVINTNFLYLPFSNINQTFSIDLIANKPISLCSAKVFKCEILKDEITLRISKEIKNDTISILSYEEIIKISAKDDESKGITAKLIVINIGHYIEIDLPLSIQNQYLFKIESNKVIGIRTWIVISISLLASFLIWRSI